MITSIYLLGSYFIGFVLFLIYYFCFKIEDEEEITIALTLLLVSPVSLILFLAIILILTPVFLVDNIASFLYKRKKRGSNNSI